MKQIFAGRPAGSFTRSKRWIAANRQERNRRSTIVCFGGWGARPIR